MCDLLKTRKNLGKTVVFAHQEFLRTTSARACESMKKLGKIGRWSLQTPPRSVFDPSKIDREASKKRQRGAGLIELVARVANVDPMGAQ